MSERVYCFVLPWGQWREIARIVYARTAYSLRDIQVMKLQRYVLNHAFSVFEYLSLHAGGGPTGHSLYIGWRISRWICNDFILPEISPRCAPALPAPRIHPPQRIRRILIKIIPTQQPNRVLRRKSAHRRIIVPERIVVQSRLAVVVLALET